MKMMILNCGVLWGLPWNTNIFIYCYDISILVIRITPRIYLWVLLAIYISSKHYPFRLLCIYKYRKETHILYILANIPITLLKAPWLRSPLKPIFIFNRTFYIISIKTLSWLIECTLPSFAISTKPKRVF